MGIYLYLYIKEDIFLLACASTCVAEFLSSYEILYC